VPHSCYGVICFCPYIDGVFQPSDNFVSNLLVDRVKRNNIYWIVTHRLEFHVDVFKFV